MIDDVAGIWPGDNGFRAWASAAFRLSCNAACYAGGGPTKLLRAFHRDANAKSGLTDAVLSVVLAVEAAVSSRAGHDIGDRRCAGANAAAFFSHGYRRRAGEDIHNT